MDRSQRTALVVFTRDLRVHDNPALSAACREADAVVPLFVVDDAIVSSAGANRIGFLAESLRDLDRSLRARGGSLVVRRGDWCDEVLATARSADARTVHLAGDVSGLAARRTSRLRREGAAIGIEVREYPGVTVVPAGDLRPSAGAENKVFTPYHRRWLSTRWRTVEDAPGRVCMPPGFESPCAFGIERLDELLPSLIDGGRSPAVIRGGEREARRRLEAFRADSLDQYAERRDLLAVDATSDATSRLSAAFHFGCLSPTEVAVRLADEPGGEAFVRQLCWRDFFHQILAARPDAAREDYRTSGCLWRQDPDALEAWRRGSTGYPLVDAAMRQLASEGFVHNRARMVVASFLCRDLLLDWRLGAAHFMSLLVDGDLADNQLNWQWVAGTGSDSNPNRIFNPVTQGRRYDPDGAYIRRHLPELAGLDSDAVHWPDLATRRRVGYPAPLVDHREAIRRWRLSARAARSSSGSAIGDMHPGSGPGS